MMIRVRTRAALVAAASLSLACSKPPASDPRMISEWMHALYGAVRVERLSPPVGSRLFAYATTGLYSGMAVTRNDLPSLEGKLNGFPALPKANVSVAYDATISAIAAERVILDSLLRD